MILKLKVTLKATEEAKTTVWDAGTEFDDSITPIPKAIMREYKIKSGLVEEVSPTAPTPRPAPSQQLEVFDLVDPATRVTRVKKE